MKILQALLVFCFYLLTCKVYAQEDSQTVETNPDIIRVLVSDKNLDLLKKFIVNFSASNVQLVTTDDIEAVIHENNTSCPGSGNYNAIISDVKLNLSEECLESTIEKKIGNQALVIISSIANDHLDLSSNDFFKVISIEFSEISKLSKHVNKNNTDEEGALIKNKQIFFKEDVFLADKDFKMYGPVRSSPLFNFIINKTTYYSCINYIQINYLNVTDKLREDCKNIKFDSVYIEDKIAGNLTLNKVSQNKKSIGIVPYNIFKQYADKFTINSFNGIFPTLENIKNDHYKLAWPIYIYISKNALSNNKNIESFFTEITSESTIGQNGYLKQFGLL